MKSSDPLAAGRMLDGRYRVHKVLGQGGMGRVYLANDTRLANRPVAVKEMIIGDGIAEKKAIEDFAREARVLAVLSHPGIPNVIDYFAEGNRHYLVMEFVAGGDLQVMLDKMGPKGQLPEPKVLRWARQILNVLAFLHGQAPPIIYRDLKPGNIMIDKDGRAMLIDFGIARFLPPGGRGTQIGSVGYAPPEQYMGKVEPRSDLYSLAATMHHLLTGRDPQLEPPFSFPSLRDLNQAVTVKTADAVMRALDKDVQKRPASARDMMHELPDPGPEPKVSAPDRAGSRAGGTPIALMPTVVLESQQPAGSSGGRLEAAPFSGATAHPPSLTTMPTVVLKRPHSAQVSNPAPPINNSRAAKPRASARSIKAAALRVAARIPAQGSLFVKPAPSVSSTAKTEDLSGKLEPAAPPAPRRSALAARPSPSSSKAGMQGGSAGRNGVSPERLDRGGSAVACLLAGGNTARFGLVLERTVIGRSLQGAEPPDIDLGQLKNSASRVSRRHAEIIKHGTDYFIRDLGSLNGTYINGRGRLGRDQLYKLKDRDQVVFGSAKLEFRKG